MNKLFAVTAVLALLCLGTLAQAVTIATVPVGNAGNTADTRLMNDGTSGYGSVGYNYNVGKYEVTAGQYTDFLNAVGATDTYGLYNTGMANTSSGSGITRSGASGSYTYSVASDFANRPVNFVSWGASARFANWLHNSQPTGAQDLSTTEDGAYYLNGATTNAQLLAVNRKTTWKWAVTSEDEWYKAAYYKGGNLNAGYWDYPTKSNSAPGRDMADASGNNANYYADSGAYPIDSGKYTTVVGEFQNSDSPYETFDQGGNVFEWNEAIVYEFAIPYRGLRGGSFLNDGDALQASNRYYDDQTSGDCYIGFRVSQVVPEPSSVLMLGSGILALAGLIRRRNG